MFFNINKILFLFTCFVLFSCTPDNESNGNQSENDKDDTIIVDSNFCAFAVIDVSRICTEDIQGLEFSDPRNGSRIIDEILLFKSFSLHRETLRQLSLDTSLEAVRSMLENFTCSEMKNSYGILQLSMKGADQEYIVLYLNKLIEIRIRNRFEQKESMAANTIYVIDEELQLTQDSLAVIEKQLANLRDKSQLLNIETEHATLVYLQGENLDSTLAKVTVNIINYKALLAYLTNDENTIISPTSMGITNPELNVLIEQLHMLYDKKRELQLTTTEKNPAYQSVVNKIEHTKKKIIENVTNLISSANATKNELKNRINSFDNSVRRFSADEIKYLILSRKFRSFHAKWIILNQKRAEASIALAAITVDHMVIERPMLHTTLRCNE